MKDYYYRVGENGRRIAVADLSAAELADAIATLGDAEIREPGLTREMIRERLEIELVARSLGDL